MERFGWERFYLINLILSAVPSLFALFFVLYTIISYDRAARKEKEERRIRRSLWLNGIRNDAIFLVPAVGSLLLVQFGLHYGTVRSWGYSVTTFLFIAATFFLGLHVLSQYRKPLPNALRTRWTQSKILPQMISYWDMQGDTKILVFLSAMWGGAFNNLLHFLRKSG